MSAGPAFRGCPSFVVAAVHGGAFALTVVGFGRPAPGPRAPGGQP